jgi:RimJ/RimL family protein N-acetyltransferase
MKFNKDAIQLRLVSEDDAAFILKLRLDSRYNQFLSRVNGDIQSQIEWIKSYKKEENAGVQYYFIIERNDQTPCGTVRLYDFQIDSFCWGSWILNEEKTRRAALESAFKVYDYGFNKLGFTKSHFDVMKNNEKVVKFHLRMGAVVTHEDEDNFYFTISRESVMQAWLDLRSVIG